MSDVKFEIEANIPEADIAKIKISNPAKITLDAYGSNVFFEAKVVKIDPAETIIEGVATYKTTLQFSGNDERVKSGMTANIDILTAKAENVIAIPQRAVAQKENGDKIVKILKDDGVVEERKVTTGLKGSDGNIEITEGIQEGEKIITSQKSS
jgi:HlyD family secretion protein